MNTFQFQIVGATSNGVEGQTLNDFVSFGLRNGYPEFRYDVGTGPAILLSRKPITLGQWHTVRITRDRKNGTLTLLNHEGHNESVVRGTVPDGRLQGLDLRGPLYLGSVPSISARDGGDPNSQLMMEVQQQTGLKKGFVGCVSRLVISGRVVKDISPIYNGRTTTKDVPKSAALRVSHVEFRSSYSTILRLSTVM